VVSSLLSIFKYDPLEPSSSPGG